MSASSTTCENRVLVLRNHGLLTVGETIGEAFLWMARMETACQYQVDILSCGRELQDLSEETQQLVIDQGRKIFGGTNGPVRYEPQWNAMLRKLERETPTDWRV